MTPPWVGRAYAIRPYDNGITINTATTTNVGGNVTPTGTPTAIAIGNATTTTGIGNAITTTGAFAYKKEARRFCRASFF